MAASVDRTHVRSEEVLRILGDFGQGVKYHFAHALLRGQVGVAAVALPEDERLCAADEDHGRRKRRER